MKMIKMALLGGAAMAVTAAGAQADDLDALKAQIETLNARVAAMETAPAVPAGYQLIAVSEGELQATPGLGFTARERAAYGNKSTVISVLPTADAPAGTTISWSGYARAGLVYSSTDNEVELQTRPTATAPWATDADFTQDDVDDTDVFARGQIRVKASTDTAVGEVGVDVRVRGNFDGVESEGNDFYMDVAWGYWAMTPELAFGGGYAGTLGDIAYGFDGACTCHYIDTLGLNPGDTSQMRLSYASGPFSFALALEDASLVDETDIVDQADLNDTTGDRLGVAGELKYSGDTVSGEISGVWRDIDDSDLDEVASEFIPSSWWQVGAGMSFALADIASLSLAAALGEGPVAQVTDYDNSDDFVFFPWNNSWWGVSGVASFSLSDEVTAELGAGYKHRDFDEVSVDTQEFTGDASAESDYWVVGGGIYYNPVDQLTVGVEASYSSLQIDASADATDPTDEDNRLEDNADRTTIDLVSVWRF